jgi:hypothetical protein
MTDNDMYANPSLDLVGLLQSRRLKGLSQILCKPSDRVFRQEILLLALAKYEGVQSTDATLRELVREGDAGYNNTQELIRSAGNLTTRRTLLQMTPAQRAKAELRQKAWARGATKVYSLRGRTTTRRQSTRRTGRTQAGTFNDREFRILLSIRGL